MYEVLSVIFFIVSVSLISFIILQQGQGTDMGTSFGTDAYNKLFGSSSFDNFMTRITVILAAIFFSLSLVLSNVNSHDEEKKWENLCMPEKTEQIQLSSQEKLNSDVPQ